MEQPTTFFVIVPRHPSTDGAGVRTPTAVGPDAGLHTPGLRPSDDQRVDLLRSVFILWPMFALRLATGGAAERAGSPATGRKLDLNRPGGGIRMRGLWIHDK